ncbi:Ribosome biogenesis protein brx1 [Clydaea vesicula]|uniref:Ribosome biogenesis protein brx1 n=1 Tax=Clydaea vesicula TaxID=447962 RepID=A0AAD5U216_9FUNG|nr:Ribosome biogenesis protein brx1 [Clydaea vesicula]KAJ3385432.1 Ribosome biogenesis protein brx1 [Lobulomyces angularis]
MKYSEKKEESPRNTKKELIFADDGGGGGDSGDEGFDSEDEDDCSESEYDSNDEQKPEKSVNVSQMGKKSFLFNNTEINMIRKPASKGDTKSDKKNLIKNRQRMLILSSRGIIHRYRHLMNDLNLLMPHSKKESKLDTKSKLYVLNELAELNNCNNAIFFEVRKHQDLYLWLAKTPNGPSIKFHVQNVHTMDELKMTGNCLKGSRPILSFDNAFELALQDPNAREEYAHLPLIKELLIHAFATPKTSRKIKPFIDHVMLFSLCDGRIWYRNYQIIEKDSIANPKEKDISLVEIGPRFVLNVIRIFDGAFGGRTLFENQDFISPNSIRREQRLSKSDSYIKRTDQSKVRNERMKDASQLPEDPTDFVF